MTTNQRHPDDRDYVMSTTASVFRIVGWAVRVTLVTFAAIAIGSVVFALGQAFWTDPLGFGLFYGPIVGLFLLWLAVQARHEAKSKALPPDEWKAHMASVYAANEARRAQEFPEDVFAEHEEQWRKELTP